MTTASLKLNRYRFIDENNEHLHTLDEKPLLGTTTVLSVINKPFAYWASGMAVGELGWKNHKREDDETYIKKGDKKRLQDRMNECLIAAGAKLTEIKLMTVKEYHELLNIAYHAHNKKKEDRAQEGTDLHAMAEEWIGSQMKMTYPLFIDPKLEPFVKWCSVNVKRFLFSEIHCYSERLWVGGKTDFGYEDMEGNYVLADIKSRDKDYFSDHVQCGGYDLQLSESNGLDKDGNVTWVIDPQRLFHFGAFDKHAVFPLGSNFKEPVFSDPIKNRKAFEFALGLYKEKQLWESLSAR